MSGERKNRENLNKVVLDQGFTLFGVANVAGIKNEFTLDEKLAAHFSKAISLGKRLLNSVMEDIKDRPTELYFHHYRQLNFFLDRGAFLTASYIQERDFQALAIPASQIIDWKNQRGHLSHKKIGRLAGLGWIGRNNLLVNPDLGARFRMVTVLTDMPLEVDEPLEMDCGTCRKCLAPCPARAIKEQRENFDHWACFEKLKEFKKSGVVSQYICGVCVKACNGQKG